MSVRDPKRILFVSHSSQMAGAEKSFLRHAEIFREQGFEVIASLPGGGPLATKLAESHFRVVYAYQTWWMSARGQSLFGLLRILLIPISVISNMLSIIRYDPDVVITNSSVIPSAAFASKITRKKHVWIIRESFDSNPSLNSILRKERIAKSLIKYSALIVPITEYVLRQIEGLVPNDFLEKKHILLCAPPVESGRFFIRDDQTMGDREVSTCLFAGTFGVDKGLNLVLDTFQEIKAKQLPLRLLIVGRGDERATNELQRRIATDSLNEYAEFIGWVEDMPKIWDRVDIFLQTANNEAFGRVTLEAMSFGIPVVGVDAGFTSELLANNCGTLVSSNVKDLVDGILDLHCNEEKRRKQAENAMKRARSYLEDDSRFEALGNAVRGL